MLDPILSSKVGRTWANSRRLSGKSEKAPVNATICPYFGIKHRTCSETMIYVVGGCGAGPAAHSTTNIISYNCLAWSNVDPLFGTKRWKFALQCKRIYMVVYLLDRQQQRNDFISEPPLAEHMAQALSKLRSVAPVRETRLVRKPLRRFARCADRSEARQAL